MYQTIFPPVSNRADWVQWCEIVNDDTGEPIEDISDLAITVEVRDQSCGRAALSAGTSNGKVSIIAPGVFQWSFTLPEMSQLCAGTYEIGVTIERDEFTTQLLIGTLPVVDGIVSR